MEKRWNMTGKEREVSIVAWFAETIRKENAEVWATPNRIAKGIGLSASTYLRSFLNGMVTDGILITRPCNKKGRWSGLEYALNPNDYHMPKKRQIALKSAGKAKGQLELW